MKRAWLTMKWVLWLAGLSALLGIPWTLSSSRPCDQGVIRERLDCLEGVYLRGSAPEAFRAMLIYGDLLETDTGDFFEEAERLEDLLLTYCRAQAVALEMGNKDEAFVAYRQARYWYLRKLQENGLSKGELADRVGRFVESSCKEFVLIQDDKVRNPSTVTPSGHASGESGNARKRERLGLRRSLGDEGLKKTTLDRFEAYLDEYLEGNTADARRAMIQAKELLNREAKGVFGEGFRLEMLQDVFSRLYCIAVADANAEEAFLNCEQVKYWWLKRALLRTSTAGDGVMECYRKRDVSSVAANGRALVSADAICRVSLVFDVKSRGGRLPAYAETVKELKVPGKEELWGPKK